MGSIENTEQAGEAFQGTGFSGRDLSNYLFEDSCDLSNVGLAGATLRGVSFADCKLLGIQWVQLHTLVNPSFHNSNLSYCGFTGLKLRKTTFQNCSLRESDYSQADVSESDFSDSDFLNARFNGTSLLKADFRGARNYLIDPIANQVRGARFSLPEAQGLLAGLGVILDG